MDQIELPTEQSAAKKADVHLQGFVLLNTVRCEKRDGWDKHPIDVTTFVVATEGMPRWDDWYVVLAKGKEARRVMSFIKTYPPGKNPEVSISGRWFSRRLERSLNRGGSAADVKAEGFIYAWHVRFMDCSAAMRQKADAMMEQEKGYG